MLPWVANVFMAGDRQLVTAGNTDRVRPEKGWEEVEGGDVAEYRCL